MIVLASNSIARRRMLEAAGVMFSVVAPNVDEESAKAGFRASGMGAHDLADALAELKANKVSARMPQDLIIGCDQTLALDDGTMLDKPGDKLAEQFRLLSGKRHTLYSAAVAARGGQPIWRRVERVHLTMRPLSEQFIADYVAQEGDKVRDCVGGYMIEGAGVQLFNKIDGSHFAILGLPLLPLLAWLRTTGEIAS